MTSELHDAIVVGGGPAGLAAALTLGRSHRRTLVLDDGEPRNATAAHMHNVLGHDGLPPAELRRRGREELDRYPAVTVRDAQVADIEDGDVFTVRLEGGEEVRARRLVLATGMRDLLPPIDGFAEAWGRTVLHCPYCHGFEVSGQRLGVLGASVHHAFVATQLQRFSPDVLLFTNGEPAPDLAGAELDVVETPVARLDQEGGVLRAVVLDDGTRVERDALFAGGPFEQRSDLAERLGCRMMGPGVEVDDFGRTSVHGVLAVGDMTRRPTLPGPMAAVSFASASGMAAGVAVDQDLHSEDSGLPSPLRPQVTAA